MIRSHPAPEAHRSAREILGLVVPELSQYRVNLNAGKRLCIPAKLPSTVTARRLNHVMNAPAFHFTFLLRLRTPNQYYITFKSALATRLAVGLDH